ncbi:MAG: glycosyltransferase [Lachnospiraceae bacterium]|nr:glycosyltransferase [Lachnospiraceae bacterium]
MEIPFFSIIMCTYNDDSFLDEAIGSVLTQSYENWELLILDNSTCGNHVWEKLCQYSEKDDRIHIMRSEKNVGWAKGASICLSKAKGSYMTFLAADDKIVPGALDCIYDECQRQEVFPDLVFIGIGGETVNHGKRVIESAIIPKSCLYRAKDSMYAMYDIMEGAYYNSFAHYERIEFLRENNIDFFEPYYADSGGMTHAITCANSIMTVDRMLYVLRLDTSQTKGHYLWGSYDYIHGQQWRDIRKMMESHTEQEDTLQYFALRIGWNLLEGMKSLCSIATVRDKYMNDMEVSGQDRLLELERVLSDADVADMLSWFKEMIYDKVEALIEQLLAIPDRDFYVEQSWLWDYIDSVYIKQGTNADKRESLSETQFARLLDSVIHPDNLLKIGITDLAGYMEQMTDQQIQSYMPKLLQVT